MSRTALVFLVLGLLFAALAATSVIIAAGAAADMRRMETELQTQANDPVSGKLVNPEVLSTTRGASTAAQELLWTQVFQGVSGTALLLCLSWFWQWQCKRKSRGVQTRWLTAGVTLAAVPLFVGSNALVRLLVNTT